MVGVLLAAGLLAPITGACSGGGDATTTTIGPSLAGVLAAYPEVSFGAELLRLTQNDDVLRGQSPHTVLVPTNAAVDAYAKNKGLAGGRELVEAVRADPSGAGAFVNNFVVDGQVNAKAFTENVGETFDTRSGIQLTIEISGGVVKLRTSNGVVTVVAVDILAGSSIAHVVDTVLS